MMPLLKLLVHGSAISLICPDDPLLLITPYAIKHEPFNTLFQREKKQMGMDISETSCLCFPLKKVIDFHKNEIQKAGMSSKPCEHVEKLMKQKSPFEVGPWNCDHELVEHFVLQVLHFITRDLTPKQREVLEIEGEEVGLLCPCSFMSSTYIKKDWFFVIEIDGRQIPKTAKFPKAIGKPAILEFTYVSN